MDYFNNAEDGHGINIMLKNFTHDENHPYANEATSQYRNTLDEDLNEHIYTEAKNDVYENTGNLSRDPNERSVQNVYTSFEPRLGEGDRTYDTLDKKENERDSEIYSTLDGEDETLRPEGIVGRYRNLKYVRTQKGSCIRRRWKLLLLLLIVLLVSISAVITAVLLVTNEEEPVEFTEIFSTTTPDDIIEGTGSGEDMPNAPLTPFD